jgi:hypothetical protein
LTRLLSLYFFSQDCGPVGASNFTKADDDGGGWWDDDDDYWTFNDGEFLGEDPFGMRSFPVVLIVSSISPDLDIHSFFTRYRPGCWFGSQQRQNKEVQQQV